MASDLGLHCYSGLSVQILRVNTENEMQILIEIKICISFPVFKNGNVFTRLSVI